MHGNTPKLSMVPLNCDSPRIAIEGISPQVDSGQFPVRRILGDIVRVEADLLCDGHGKLAGEILFCAPLETKFQSKPLALAGNDRWFSEFTVERLGRHRFKVVAWKDDYASLADEITKKHQAGLPTHLEVEEGLMLIRETLQHGRSRIKPLLTALLNTVHAASEDERRAILLSASTMALMREADLRKFSVTSHTVIIDAEPANAAFASWYEIFPRSQAGDGIRHGNFQDVIGQLPRVAAMGFDVLYFPPIHPIGETNRKGRNNTLTPAVTDPGSPYAIGNDDGGHDAIHPELGTLEDFHDLHKAASALGITLALDFAIQCSPDHPWLKSNKDWFSWRPDGSIRYAENPPKKYEDIVNVDFYTPSAKPGLWIALRDVVQFWVDQGIRLFRVDNPHTKPFSFWEWLISDIRSRHPDAIFLAEAFTRPKIMYRLAKIGFSQSYTYFTWRNTKAEIEEYLTELTTTSVKDYFRPHFFVNTPDINPPFLQTSGRPGHLIRAALAATLSGLWGVYNGFELCEARPIPGREEYFDSEKYALKAWDYEQPGNIIAQIAALNRIRRENTALHSHLGLEFLLAYNDQVLYFRKYSADGDNVLLVAISLDPFNVQGATIEVPLGRFGLPDNGDIHAEDLMRGVNFTWHGKFQPVHLNPDELPFCIWRLTAPKTQDT
jgi:starch synthase (maltosyl-transferring)